MHIYIYIYIHQGTESSLAQIKFKYKYKIFFQENPDKNHLQNVNHFIDISMCLELYLQLFSNNKCPAIFRWVNARKT